jgi:amidase
VTAEPEPAPDPVCDLPAAEQAALLRAGQLSARELLAAHRQRIEAVDGVVNAVVTRTWDRAEAEAADCDEDAAHGRWRGPLHGLVLAHKDLDDTAGIRTTYGSPVFADHVPDADHPVVARVVAAGAVTVGKTNTPEFGAGSHTLNPVFGVTGNPWAPQLSAGGSSGGAAAAVAAGMLSLAVGSDVGGSLRNPPAFCGVVGLRPSVGRVPNTGPGHQHHRLPTHGPIGRCVDDVALGLSVLAGPAPPALLALPEPGSSFAPPLAALAPDAGRPLRVALSLDLGGLPVEAAARTAVRAAAERLADAGWQVEEADPPVDGADACFAVLRAFMYASDLGRRLRPADVARLKATVRQEIQEGLAITTAQVAEAFAAETALAQQALDFFDTYDLLLSPTTQALPFPVENEWVTVVDGVPMQRYTDWMRSCTRLSVLGVPALSLPAGLVRTPDGVQVPVGVQLAARAGADLFLLRAAKAAEGVLGRLGTPPLDPLLRAADPASRSTARNAS